MTTPNIYTMIVFDLHPKVRDFIDRLNNDGQIDQDESGYPYLIGSDRQGTNIITRISRNNRLENFVINPRKKKEPLCSWQMNDGFVRPESKKVTIIQKAENGPTKERERRMVSESSIKHMVNKILGD